MYKLVCKPGKMYETDLDLIKQNSNCPDSEKSGSGPGSCGGSSGKSTTSSKSTLPTMSKDDAVKNGLINAKGKVLKPFREEITQTDGTKLIREFQKSGAVKVDTRSAKNIRESSKLQAGKKSLGFSLEKKKEYEQPIKNVSKTYTSNGIPIEHLYAGIDDRTSDIYKSTDKQSSVTENPDGSGFTVSFSDNRPPRTIEIGKYNEGGSKAHQVAKSFVDNSGPSDMSDIMLEPGLNSSTKVVDSVNKMISNRITSLTKFIEHPLIEEDVPIKQDTIKTLNDISNIISKAKSEPTPEKAMSFIRNVFNDKIVEKYQQSMNPLTPKLAEQSQKVAQNIDKMLIPTPEEIKAAQVKLGIT